MVLVLAQVQEMVQVLVLVQERVQDQVLAQEMVLAQPQALDIAARTGRRANHCASRIFARRARDWDAPSNVRARIAIRYDRTPIAR